MRSPVCCASRCLMQSAGTAGVLCICQAPQQHACACWPQPCITRMPALASHSHASGPHLRFPAGEACPGEAGAGKRVPKARCMGPSYCLLVEVSILGDASDELPS